MSVYRRFSDGNGESWELEDELSAGDFCSAFGSGVSVSGDLLVVGGSGYPENCGRGYVFRYDGARWREEQELVGADVVQSDYFGSAVAVSGDIALVGAHASAGWGYNGSGFGYAYLFRYDGDEWHDNKAKVQVGFTSGGRFFLDTNNSNKTGSGRSLFIDFGEPVTVTDSSGISHTFTSTADLDTQGIEHDAAVGIGIEEWFNMFSMELGEFQDVNFACTLFLHFPGVAQETPIFIKLAPNPVGNGRFCSTSDPVRIECQGLDVNDDCNSWTVTTAIDDDLDGIANEDPVDGVDNDGDELIDEDDYESRACVSQQPFDTQTIGWRTLDVFMIISSGVPSPQGAGGALDEDPVRFVRGDANSDRGVDLTDAFSTLEYLFASASALPCADAADADDDGALSIVDAVFTLGFLFSGGPAFPAPYPEPGTDPTSDPLGCRVQGAR